MCNVAQSNAGAQLCLVARFYGNGCNRRDPVGVIADFLDGCVGAPSSVPSIPSGLPGHCKPLRDSIIINGQARRRNTLFSIRLRSCRSNRIERALQLLTRSCQIDPQRRKAMRSEQSRESGHSETIMLSGKSICSNRPGCFLYSRAGDNFLVLLQIYSGLMPSWCGSASAREICAGGGIFIPSK